MYETPMLERYGTFRQLTESGGTRDVDTASIFDTTDSCEDAGGDPNTGTYTCYSA